MFYNQAQNWAPLLTFLIEFKNEQNFDTTLSSFLQGHYYKGSKQVDDLPQLSVCWLVRSLSLAICCFFHRHSPPLYQTELSWLTWLVQSRIVWQRLNEEVSLPLLTSSIVGCRVFDVSGLTLWHLKWESPNDFEELMVNWLEILAHTEHN